MLVPRWSRAVSALRPVTVTCNFRIPVAGGIMPDLTLSPHTQSSARALTLYARSPCRPSSGLSVGSASRCLVIALLVWRHNSPAITTITSPAGSHLSESLSLSQVGRQALEKCHRLESRAMAPRLDHLLQSHRPILKLPPHDIPLSTWMCDRRTHRSYLYARGGERHAHNTQVAHDILWCTHISDYPPQSVHVRRHRGSNSCAASGARLEGQSCTDWRREAALITMRLSKGFIGTPGTRRCY